MTARTAYGLSRLGEDWRVQGKCWRRDPQMWDTGHEGNELAKALCRRCPIRARCKADPRPAVGIIRAGVAYDDYGHAEGQARPKPAPAPRRVATPTEVSERRDRVIALLSQDPRPSYAQVAQIVGSTRLAVKSVWLRHANREGIDRSAQTNPSSGHRSPRPTTIDRWHELQGLGLTRREVADRLGITPQALYAAMSRARNAGDPRVPAENPRRAAA